MLVESTRRASLSRAMISNCTDILQQLVGHPINELVQYVLSLTDIIYANEHGKNSWDVLKWDVLKSVGRKYEKGKLLKVRESTRRASS